MSVRRTLKALQNLGGEATLRQLQESDYNAGDRIRKLVQQGYVERLAPGRYRLTATGHQLRVETL